MVTDRQVRLLRKKLMQGKRQESAAAASGMSERSARRWKEGPLPSETKKPRTWRTRVDPFAGDWERILVPLLERDDKRELEARTLLAELQDGFPGKYEDGSLRTLQRRMRDALRSRDRAAGRCEGFFEAGLKLWDCLAGSILVEEAGGRVSHYDGSPLGLDPSTILVSNGPLHDEMLDVVRSADKTPS